MFERFTRCIRRRRARDDAVSEVLGFVLMFALSSIVLVTSVQSFNAAKDNADAIVSGVELRGVSNRVSTRVVQSALLAEDFPNATMAVSVRVPSHIGEQPYWIQPGTSGSKTVIRAATINGDYSATASIFNVDRVGLTVDPGGKMYSTNESLTVTVHPGDRAWNFTAGSQWTANTTIQLKGVHS